MDENVELILEALKELKKHLKCSDNDKYNSLEFVKAKSIREIENILIIFYLEDLEDQSLKFEQYHINHDSFLNYHQLLRTQLEADNLRMIIARYRNDFMDFCRFAWLQIEPIIDFLIQTNYRYNNDLFQNAYVVVSNNISDNSTRENFIRIINQNDMTKVWMQQKIELSLIIISNNSDNIYQDRLNEERKNYLLLLSIYKLRNIASHREEGKTIIQRIENINYNVVKNKVSELYNLKPYLSIKKTIHWFICRCNQWIPPQARR
ncbi:hypothetical protein [Geminocystis sp. NIES-3709]|uniref:hypothetical protein n=1 Tax=Geminocystis sp. NIES-3709 TaxID=1617448 RepID=UPI0005FCC9E0|nr:hypothetical protein [Geminocystis sp. NIES-3709]BAQ66979.1 hypothetical protein GM3709_3744 [Geminocystis sp. NIES-3709]